jgi:UDP-N-acetylglucosamine 2-epimerase (non-hydrolysing)
MDSRRFQSLPSGCRSPGSLTFPENQNILNKIKVLSVFGTRPEAIKMAPVVLALRQTAGIDARVCVTGQHREMLDQVLNLFDIQPDADLDLMQPNQQLAQLTSEVLTNIDPYLVSFQPDWVLVQGDTTTAMAAALAAFYRRIKVGHVEAGLRTYDKWQPFPEEINRRMISSFADLHFAPTSLSCDNLLREGIPQACVSVTGNTVVDALQMIVHRPAPVEVTRLLNEIGIGENRRLVLITAHRRENFGKPLESICQSIQQLAVRYGESVQFIYPVHPNPNVHDPVHKILSGIPSVHLLSPLDYLPLVHFLKNSSLVLTDSGGIQEEAVSLGIPTLVLRDKTERPEGLDSGILKLVGTDSKKIVLETCQLLDERDSQNTSATTNPFGDGQAAQRIVASILSYSGKAA